MVGIRSYGRSWSRSEQNKALARRSWEAVDNPDLIERSTPQMSSGTNLIETSTASKKLSSSSPSTRPLSPT
jgi:hypothetical protein